MLDLGTARGAITLDAEGFLSGVGIVKSGVEDLGGVGETAGRGLSTLSDHIDNVIDSMGKFSGVARIIDGVARSLGALAITGGVTLIAGGARAAWDQVRAVQNATSALRAYEKDASKVDAVLKGLLDYARSDLGVLFSRQELFAAAQGLKLYGAETNNLVRYVEIMSRSVGLGLSNWDQLGTVIGRVGSTGRLVGNDFDYLTAAGYQLDESLRNANLTWDQLFDALDAGIPKDALAGIAENIDGLMVRVRSAVRDIGNAFLGVDSQTSQFIEGGLGAQLVVYLQDAPGLIRNMTGVAASLGNTVATTLGIVGDFINAYQRLPGPVRDSVEWILKLVAAYGALRVASSALGLVSNAAGFGGLLTSARGISGEFMAAARGTQSFSTSLTSLVFSINPLKIAMGGIIALGVSWVLSYTRQKQAIDDYNQSVTNLEVTLEDLRRQGMRALADEGEGLAGIIQNLDERSASLMETWRDSTEVYSAEWEQIQNFQEVTLEQQRQLNDLLNEALSDPNIDIDGWISWATSLLEGADSAEELKASVELILDTPLSDWAIDSANSINTLSFGMDGLTSSQRSFNLEMAQMRIDGNGEMADTLTRLNELFGDNSRASGVAAEYLEFFRSNVEAGNFDLDDYASRIEALNFLYDAGLLPQFQYDQMIIQITKHATEAATASRSWEDAIREGVDQGSRSAAIALQELNQRIAENREALLAVGGYDDPLSQWNLSGRATDMSMLAMNARSASTALDNTFRVIVSNTNAIANQVDSVQQWAEGLAEANIAVEEAARIGAANERVQASVLAIQERQAPLVAQQTENLADYMDTIALLPAKQQLVALGWMDTATAAQAMEFQTLAVAAATGELGKQGDVVFANMISSAAMVNPALAAVLEDMGLISVGADGTITVHLSGVSEGISEMDRLTVAIVSFLDITDDGELNGSISFDTLGLDDPRRKLEDLEDVVVKLDDSEIRIGVEVDDTEADPGLSNLITSLQDNMPTIKIPVQVQTVTAGQAGNSLGQAAAGALGSLATDLTFTVGANTSPAERQIQSLMEYTKAINESSTVANVDADTSSAHRVLSLLDKRLDNLEGRTTVTKVDANTVRADQMITAINRRLDLYQSRRSITVLDANTIRADQAVTAINSRLNLYQNRIAITVLDANTIRADRMVTAINNRLNLYQNRISITVLDANTIRADQMVTAINNRLNLYQNRTATAKLDANSVSAHTVITLLDNRISGLNGRTANVYIHAIDFATSTINSVARSLSDLNGRTATTYSNHISTVVNRAVGGSGYVGYADGGIVREPVVLVGEDGPELVALPYGSQVFSNSDSMAMMRRSPAPMPRMATEASSRPVINNYYEYDYSDNSTNTTASAKELSMIARRAERGEAAFNKASSRRARSRYEGNA